MRDATGLAEFLSDAADQDRTQRLRIADRQRLRTAVHESGHAIAATLLGGGVSRVVVGPGYVPGTKVYVKGYTLWNNPADDEMPAVIFAGPWCEARWFAGCPPTWRDLRRAFADQPASPLSDERKLWRHGGCAPDSFGVAALFESNWDSVIALAKTLILAGEAGHTEVCQALGITDDTGQVAQ